MNGNLITILQQLGVPADRDTVNTIIRAVLDSFDIGDKSVDSLLKTALLTVGVPVERIFYDGEAETFITFQIIVGTETGHADDESGATEFVYRVDIYSKTNFITIMRRTIRAVKAAGFYGVSVESETYESDTGYYHVPLEIKYMEV